MSSLWVGGGGGGGDREIMIVQKQNSNNYLRFFLLWLPQVFWPGWEFDLSKLQKCDYFIPTNKFH